MRSFLCLCLMLIACDQDKGVTVLNTPPDAAIISHADGDEVFEGYAVEFRAALSDANHEIDQLTARWKVNGEEVCPFLPSDENGESVCVTTISTDQQEVSVEVRDPDNASGSDFIVLSIVPTEPPAAQIIRPQENGVFYSDYPITFEGFIADAEDEAVDLTYEWVSNIDGVLNLSTTVEDDGSMLGSGYLSEEIHFITLRVEDTTGKSATASTTITVGGPNSNPTCAVTAPQSGFAAPFGDTISFEGIAQDVDIDSNLLSVEWSSNKMDEPLGVSPPNSDGDVLFSYADLTVDTHTITMTVTDEKGATCSDFISVAVGTPPSVQIDSPLAGTYNEGEALTFSATVSDNEDQPDEVLLVWSLSDGTVLSEQPATSDGQAQFVLSDLPFGEYIVNLHATDADGLTASDLVNLTINALPTAPSLSVVPEEPVTSDDLVANATGSTDPDGGNITYSYEWVYGSQTISGANLPSSYTAKGELWTVTSTPNDGIADGESSALEVLIGNTPPADAIVTISYSELYNDSALACSATASDLDGDMLIVSYEWSTGETSNFITLDGSLDPTEVVTCTATLSDGTDSTVGMASVTLENRIPEVLAVNVTPNPAVLGQDDLTCEVMGADADLDVLYYTYTWSNSVGAQQITTEVTSNTDVFLAAGLSEDVWTCEVRPYDGIDYGQAQIGIAAVEGGCPAEGTGYSVDCPSLDCAKILEDGHSVGDGFYWIDPLEEASAYEVYCLMDVSYDGGGWTLISVHSDDGQDTWTWNNRHYFDTDTATFGSLDALNEDFKSPALHEVGMEDMLFIHAPSGIWAAYSDVDTGSDGFGVFLAEYGGPNCIEHGQGVPLSEGTLTATENLCSTELFFSVYDYDGSSVCQTDPFFDKSWGPTWSADDDSGCPFDDPGLSGLGPNGATSSTHQSHEYADGLSYIGFGESLGLNTGASDQAENFMSVYVRRDYADSDGDQVLAWEDCDDSDPLVSNCYLFAVFAPKERSEAELDCNERGGHLAWIDNASENDVVLALCEDHTSDEGCHIGLEAPFASWSSGVAVTYTNWYEPHFSDGAPGQEETWIYTSRRGIPDGIGLWDDFGGGDISYVCRLPSNGDVSGALGFELFPIP